MKHIKGKTLLKKIASIIFLVYPLFSQEINNYKYGCPIPDILIQTIRLTENEKNYPYLIRTNDKKNLKTFENVIKKYPHNYENKNDKLVIDCHNEDNCVSITIALIDSGISNLDLGLFQINYDSFPFNIYTYFNEEFGYRNACKVVLSKIKITKNWDWRTLAAYYSLTPELNQFYQMKLIKNYNLLRQKNNINKLSKNDELKTINENIEKSINQQKDFFKVSKENLLVENE